MAALTGAVGPVTAPYLRRRSSGVFGECSRAWRQLNPGVPPTVVDRNGRRRKVRVGKRTYGNADSAILAHFGVEDVSPTDRAKPEDELGSLVAGTDVFGGVAEDLEGCVKAGQCGEYTAGPLLTGKAVADAYASWLTRDSNPQLST